MIFGKTKHWHHGLCHVLQSFCFICIINFSQNNNDFNLTCIMYQLIQVRSSLWQRILKLCRPSIYLISLRSFIEVFTHNWFLKVNHTTFLSPNAEQTSKPFSFLGNRIDMTLNGDLWPSKTLTARFISCASKFLLS